MRRLVWKASECVKEGITRDALARQQLQSGLLDVTNLGNVPSALPAPALARLVLECTPFPQRPALPLVSDGVTAQFTTVTQPSEVETLF